MFIYESPIILFKLFIPADESYNLGYGVLYSKRSLFIYI